MIENSIETHNLTRYPNNGMLLPYYLYTGRIPTKTIELNDLVVTGLFKMLSSIDKIEQYLRDNEDTANHGSQLLRDIAYERLKEAIQNSDVEAGDPLSESRLSAILGISRTPVREALQQLVTDGLLQLIPGRGTVIAARSVQQVSDALHVRELLEPEVIRLAAEALPNTVRQQLVECTVAMEKAAREDDRYAWAKVDRNWHELLCNNCPNQLLGQMVLQARNHMHNQGAFATVSDQYLIDGTQEHRVIVDAILNRDGKLAAELMLQHLVLLRENVFKRQA